MISGAARRKKRERERERERERGREREREGRTKVSKHISPERERLPYVLSLHLAFRDFRAERTTQNDK